MVTRFRRGSGELYTAGLAAATRMNLRLHNHWPVDACSNLLDLGGRTRDVPVGYGHAE
jgi:hypothetical protein